MLYTVKFNNGFWKVFNTFTFTDVHVALLKKEAEEVAAQLNAKKGKKNV